MRFCPLRDDHTFTTRSFHSLEAPAVAKAMARQAEIAEKWSFLFAGIPARHCKPLKRGGPMAANENHQSRC
jgi:hypothetical protein